MAESEQAHRISFEQSALKAAIADKKRGQYFGGSIGVLAIVGAVVTVIYGAPWQVPVALVGVPVLGIVQALIGRSEKIKNT
jgi:heme A synthase